MGRRLKSQEVVFNALLPIAEERCHERDLKAAGQTVPHHVNYTSYFTSLALLYV